MRYQCRRIQFRLILIRIINIVSFGASHLPLSLPGENTRAIYQLCRQQWGTEAHASWSRHWGTCLPWGTEAHASTEAPRHMLPMRHRSTCLPWGTKAHASHEAPRQMLSMRHRGTCFPWGTVPMLPMKHRGTWFSWGTIEARPSPDRGTEAHGSPEG